MEQSKMQNEPPSSSAAQARPDSSSGAGLFGGEQRSRGEVDLARRKLTRRALWVAPALVVGLTLTRTAAATGIEPCEGRDCP